VLAQVLQGLLNLILSVLAEKGLRDIGRLELGRGFLADGDVHRLLHLVEGHGHLG
jgi:hypothetical protein